MNSNKDLEQKALKQCQKVIDYYKANGKYPSARSKDIVEVKLAQWLNNLRRAKQGKGRSTFYKSVEEVCHEVGYTELFETVNTEKQVIDKCVELIEWMNEHGREPKRTSKDSTEFRFRSFLDSLRLAKTGKNKRVFYPALQVLADSAGYPDLFKVKK